MQDIKNYNNVFNLKNAFTLFDHKKNNYNIDLLLNKELFYKFFFFFQERTRCFARISFKEFDIK